MYLYIYICIYMYVRNAIGDGKNEQTMQAGATVVQAVECRAALPMRRRDCLTTRTSNPLGRRFDRVIEGQTYSFKNLLVRTFQGKKHLSTPKHAAIETDDDTTDVASAESAASDSDSSTTLHEAEIIMVPVFKSYTACLACKPKLEPKQQQRAIARSVPSPSASTNVPNNSQLRSSCKQALNI